MACWPGYGGVAFHLVLVSNENSLRDWLTGWRSVVRGTGAIYHSASISSSSSSSTAGSVPAMNDAALVSVAAASRRSTTGARSHHTSTHTHTHTRTHARTLGQSRLHCTLTTSYDRFTSPTVALLTSSLK